MSLKTNLISYYKLDGNSNDSVASNNGTNTNISFDNAYGKINNGASYTSTSSKIILSSQAQQSAGTVNLWVKPLTNFNVEKSLFTDRDATNRAGMCQIQISTAGKLNLLVSNGSSWVINSTSSSAMSINNWYMMTWVWDATDGHKIYINNSAWITNTTVRSAFTGVVDQVIGNLNFGGNDTYGSNKYIDEVGIWSRALSSTEIGELYNSGNGLSYDNFAVGNTGAFFNFF